MKCYRGQRGQSNVMGFGLLTGTMWFGIQPVLRLTAQEAGFFRPNCKRYVMNANRIINACIHSDYSSARKRIIRIAQHVRPKCGEGGNVFEELMEATKVASLGQITDALFAADGQYLRNM